MWRNRRYISLFFTCPTYLGIKRLKLGNMIIFQPITMQVLLVGLADANLSSHIVFFINYTCVYIITHLSLPNYLENITLFKSLISFMLFVVLVVSVFILYFFGLYCTLLYSLHLISSNRFVMSYYCNFSSFFF